MSEKSIDYQIKADRVLLEYLRPRTTERTSKLDAYCELMNMAMMVDEPHEVSGGSTVKLHKGQLAVTVSDLAKRWNWHRVTVKSFLDRLVELNHADLILHGKMFILTMRYAKSFQTTEESPLLKDEQKIVRWVSGYIGFEEMLSSCVDLLNDTDLILHSHRTSECSTVGSRLHRLLAHLIINYTDIIPEQKNISEALARLFTDHCHSDFSEFLSMLGFGGLHFSTAQNEIPKPYLATLPEDVAEQLRIVFGYYVSLIHPASKK